MTRAEAFSQLRRCVDYLEATEPEFEVESAGNLDQSGQWKSRRRDDSANDEESHG